jgi:hypothetical protein
MDERDSRRQRDASKRRTSPEAVPIRNGFGYSVNPARRPECFAPNTMKMNGRNKTKVKALVKVETKMNMKKNIELNTELKMKMSMNMKVNAGVNMNLEMSRTMNVKKNAKMNLNMTLQMEWRCCL